jgi:hypothetical protein
VQACPFICLAGDVGVPKRARHERTTLLNYRLSRLFYDLHTDRSLAEAYRSDRGAVVARYALSDADTAALLRDDVAYLALHTNPFLLRYYFLVVGMSEAAFIGGLQAGGAAHHG